MEEDLVLNCKDCSSAFTFTVGEQRFYAARKFLNPARCPGCRAARKASGPRGQGSGVRGQRRGRNSGSRNSDTCIHRANSPSDAQSHHSQGLCAEGTGTLNLPTPGLPGVGGLRDCRESEESPFRWWKGDCGELSEEEAEVLQCLDSFVHRSDPSGILELMDLYEGNLNLLHAGCSAFCSLPSTRGHLKQLATVVFCKVLNGTINTKLCAGLVAVTEGFMPRFDPGFWNSFFAYFLQNCQDMMGCPERVEGLRLEEEKRIAFALLLHNRVGASSSMRGLNGDLVSSILEHAEELVRRQRTLIFQELLAEMLRSKAIGSSCIKILMRQRIHSAQEIDLESICEFISKAGTLLDNPRYRMKMDDYLKQLSSQASKVAQSPGGQRLSKRIKEVVDRFNSQRSEEWDEEALSDVSNIMKLNLKLYS